MKKFHWMSLLTLAALALATSAFATTRAPAAPAAPAAPHEMQFSMAPDDESGGAGDEMEWAMDDGDDLLFMGGSEDGGPVIERRVVRRGPGMGRGMGMGPGARHGRMGGHFAAILHQLDLTDAQKEKVHDIHERQLRRDIQARADLQIARLDLRKLMMAEKSDAAAINAQIDKLSRMRADMAKAHVATLFEAKAMLTPEQQKKMRELHLHGMGMGMGHGPGGMLHMQGGPGMGGMHGPGGAPRPMRMQIHRDSAGRGPQ